MENTYATGRKAIEQVERNNKGFLLFAEDGDFFRIYSARLTPEDIASYIMEVISDMPDVKEMVSRALAPPRTKSGLILPH